MAAILSRPQCVKSSQKSPHSLPTRVRYGVSFAISKAGKIFAAGNAA